MAIAKTAAVLEVGQPGVQAVFANTGYPGSFTAFSFRNLGGCSLRSFRRTATTAFAILLFGVWIGTVVLILFIGLAGKFRDLIV
jgi:hypothetical protein